MITMTKQCQQSDVNNDGNDGYGGDSNCGSDSDGNDATAATNGNNVDDDNGGIQGRQ
jgi:hypothetical protein